MSVFDDYNELGKNTITATRSDFSKSVGIEGTKDIVKSVLLGGNVRDTTEFITQRRLLNSYASMFKFFSKILDSYKVSTNDYVNQVTNELKNATGDEKIFDLWLLGLTKKGFDNILRGKDNIDQYGEAFKFSINEAINDFEKLFGELTGCIKIGDSKFELNWSNISLLSIALGSQTLTIRGSSKSMNGKMFEKLVLGSLLTIMGFTYLDKPPTDVEPTEKLFWLSHMDENERETDATLIYNKLAISIDIGFIGRGNPEITLDKVTRFGAYKHIGGIDHNMSTIIIIDTIAENSDLINKAARVNGHVLQMKDKDWVIKFAKLLCDIYKIEHSLTDIKLEQLSNYIEEKLNTIDITEFFE